jgi:DNA-binding beta-propeller fold protein YncE
VAGTSGGAGGGAAGGAGAGGVCGRREISSLVLGQPDFASSTPGSGASSLAGPFGGAIDPTSGKVFVADYVNNRVLRFPAVASLTNGSAAEAVLGQADFTSSDISTTASRMDNPIAVAVDGAGRLWVADEGHHRVLRFDGAAAKASGAAADGVLGQATLTNSTIGLGVSAMNRPTGVAVDAAGRVFVADLGNARVLRFDAAAGKANGANADGVLGQPDFDQNAVATTQSGLYAPQSLAVDAAGRLWVADQGNSRILRFDSPGMKANGAPADAVLGQASFTDREQQALQNRMFGPTGVTVDSDGVLWVADRGNHRLLCFTNPAAKPNGGVADGVLGQSSFTAAVSGTAPDRFNSPSGVASDSAGRLLVVDYENHRVVFFDR